MTSHFKGSSLEFKAVGLRFLYLTETDELITIKRPDNSANNIIFGQLYVDLHGDMLIKNHKTGDTCNVHISR